MGVAQWLDGLWKSHSTSMNGMLIPAEMNDLEVTPIDGKPHTGTLRINNESTQHKSTMEWTYHYSQVVYLN